jgi:hypothetical protein
MGFRRRKKEDRDPFAHLEAERQEAESGTPWFLGTEGANDLDIQAGISSNLRDDDLDRRYEAERRARYEAEHVQHYDDAYGDARWDERY